MHAATRDLLSHRPLAIRVVLVTLVLQAVRISNVHLLLMSLGATVPIQYSIAFVPMIILLTLLPISFFGLGIQEGAFVHLYGQVGVAGSIALGASLLMHVLFLSFSLCCGIAFLSLGKGQRRLPLREARPVREKTE